LEALVVLNTILPFTPLVPATPNTTWSPDVSTDKIFFELAESWTMNPLAELLWKVLAPAKVCVVLLTMPATLAEAVLIANVILSGLVAVFSVQVVPATVPVAATSRKLASVAAVEFTVILSPPPLPQEPKVKGTLVPLTVPDCKHWLELTAVLGRV
jgi:hypothetical protein